MSRLNRALVILIFAAALFGPLFGAQFGLGFDGPQAALFHPKTHTLANGMQVVVIEDHRAPVVSHMVWYKIGSADEPPGKSGIAHFLEHLLFKGTAKYASGQFSKIIARNGGRENAFTSYDYTGYYQNVAKDKLDLVMGLEADRMVNLELSEDDVLTEGKEDVSSPSNYGQHLSEAQAIFVLLGACKEEYIGKVRKPTESELPDVDWKILPKAQALLDRIENVDS